MLKEFINGMSFLLSPFSRIFNDNAVYPTNKWELKKRCTLPVSGS